MKTPILTFEELTQQGFQQIGDKELLDQEGNYYKWWVCYKGESEIHITYEYDLFDNFKTGYVELNGQVLNGRELLKSDIKLLIAIM